MSVERPQQLLERKESIDYKELDAIVVLGRGVWMNKSGNWAPTGLFEEGKGKYKAHSGVAPTHELDPNKKRTGVVVGGANSNDLACFHILKALRQEGVQELPYVVFAAGRPNYLIEKDQDGEISEGSVLRDKLVRMLTANGIEVPDHEVQDKNKATIDDIRESLGSCVERGCNNVGIITIEPHVLRAWQMARKVITDDPNHFYGMKVGFIDSWDVLSQVDRRFENIFEDVQSTLGYRRTERLEKAGRAALKRNVTNTQNIKK